jgi:peptidoglycan/LPS O-acetylase OafA/YrhL
MRPLASAPAGAPRAFLRGLQVRLSDYAVGRDNNFTLLRFSAAMTVLFAHSVAVLGLPPEREFFFNRLGFSLGEMGLDMLFVTSGFLVTASLVVRQDLIAYLWARILRVYPGMWVMLVLTVFVLAPALTTLPRDDYYASPLTWEYFRKCATLIGGVRYSLPGVFDNVPLKGEFNGSLWTMPVEVRMYLYLAAIYVALAIVPALRLKAMRVVLPLSAAVLIAIVMSARLTGGAYNGANIRVFMFLYGSSLFVWRDRIPVGPRLLVGILAALALASFDKTLFFVVYAACLAPLVLHLVYVPGGRIRAFNDWGDYSYGVYIYAFPVQQTLAFLFPAMSLAGMMASSAVVSVAIAIVSWKLIEERALARKGEFAEATSRAFNLGLAKIRWPWRLSKRRGTSGVVSDAPVSQASGATSVSSGK